MSIYLFMFFPLYFLFSLNLSWRRPLSYTNQSIDLQSKSMDWFIYDNGLRHERVNETWPIRYMAEGTIFYGGYVDVL